MREIREQRAGDVAAVEAVVRAAFGQDEEARLVDRLRADNAFLFSLVAEESGIVVGHAGFARAAVASAQGNVPVAWLVPLSVAPDHQRRGVGSALVRTGHELCRERGLGHVLVVGDRAYYRRFGYSREAAKDLTTRWPEALLAAALADDAVVPSGNVVEPAAFADLGSD